MRPDPGPVVAGRPEAPVSAAAVLEVAAGLRELDPQLSAELARHAARLAGTDGDVRRAAERVSARSLVEARRAVEVVERTVPTLRSALRRGARDDEVPARCDLALAALRCRATALAAALVAPIDTEGLPTGSRAEAALRVAQVRAAEGDVDGTDRAVARARAGRPEVGGPGDTLFEVDLERARGGARRRRGDTAGCVAVLTDLRARVPDTAELDGGRRSSALVADHVSALVEAGALDDARAAAAAWTPGPSRPSTAATALGLGRLRVVVAGRLHLPAAPEAALSLAGDAERDLADAAHHREAAEAARVVAEASELCGQWPEALTALRRARAHDTRAWEEERFVDRLLAGVLGYGEGMSSRGGAGEGDAAGLAPPIEDRAPAPPVGVPEIATAPVTSLTSGGGAPAARPVEEQPARGSATRRRRRRADDDAAPALPARAPTASEPVPALPVHGTGGGRRRRPEPDPESHAPDEPSAAPGSPRPRHGRAATAVRDGGETDGRGTGAGNADDAGAGASATQAPAPAPGGTETPASTGRSSAPAAPGAGAAGPGHGGVPHAGVHDVGDDHAHEQGDAFSTAPEPRARPGVESGAGSGGDEPGADRDGAGRGAPAAAGESAGRPLADPDQDDPLGVGRLLRRDAATEPAPAETPWGPAGPGPAAREVPPAAWSPEPRPAPAPGTAPRGRPVSRAGPASGPSSLGTGSVVPAGGDDELPLTLVGLLAEYDLPGVSRPVPPSRSGSRPGGLGRVGGGGGPGGNRGSNGPDGGDGRRDGGGAGDADGGARLADLLADAMDAFRRAAPETGPTAVQGAPADRPRS